VELPLRFRANHPVVVECFETSTKCADEKFAKKAVYTTPFIIMNGVQHVHLVTFNVEKECSPYSINENRYNDLLQNSAN
jgi:hypothetical protein